MERNIRKQRTRYAKTCRVLFSKIEKTIMIYLPYHIKMNSRLSNPITRTIFIYRDVIITIYIFVLTCIMVVIAA